MMATHLEWVIEVPIIVFHCHWFERDGDWLIFCLVDGSRTRIESTTEVKIIIFSRWLDFDDYYTSKGSQTHAEPEPVTDIPIIDQKLVLEQKISLLGGQQYKIIIMYNMVAFNGHRIITKKPSLFLSNILRPFHPIRRVCGITKR